LAMSMDIVKGIKHTLFFGVIALMLLPEAQRRWKLFPDFPLQGAYVAVDPPSTDSLNWETWMSADFQQTFNDRLETNIGFHDWLVRINNQLAYSMFKETTAKGVIVGQQGELFEEDYIKAYLGEFFIGERIWKEKAEKLKMVQDTLASMGKTLLVVFEPGKGSFCPEKFPEKYTNVIGKTSNYDYFLKQLEQKNVNTLDLIQFFALKKNSSDYLLFPRTGTHWSYYGAALAADTTLAHLQQLHGRGVPDMTIDSLSMLPKARHPDDDIWLAMNVLMPVPMQNLAYPRLSFDMGIQNEKCKILVAGDSFYFNWQSDGVMLNAFENADFWYYNQSVWNRQGVETGKTNQLDFRSEVLSRDIILIMITERFHHNFAWKFDEQLFDLFYPGQSDIIEHFANNLRVGNDEFMRLVNDAKVRKISIEDRVRMEAEFLLYEDYQRNPDKYARKEDLITIFMMSIRGTPDWYAKVEEKARSRNISVDQMIRMDAEWLYNDKYGNNPE
jgi:hypothetical protein